MNSCQTCRHWQAPRSAQQLAESLRGAPVEDIHPESWPELRGYGRCSVLTTEHGETSERLAFAVDYEEFCAYFYSKPNFGCRLHSAGA